MRLLTCDLSNLLTLSASTFSHPIPVLRYSTHILALRLVLHPIWESDSGQFWGCLPDVDLRILWCSAVYTAIHLFANPETHQMRVLDAG